MCCRSAAGSKPGSLDAPRPSGGSKAGADQQLVPRKGILKTSSKFPGAPAMGSYQRPRINEGECTDGFNSPDKQMAVEQVGV